MQIQRGESLDVVDIILIIIKIEEIIARGKVLSVNCKSREIS
jgi:hypothetical protein